MGLLNGNVQDFFASTVLEQAVALGHVKAMASLGGVNLNGQGGARDLEEAKRLFMHAAKVGD
jgi:TPR repeat protein